MQQCAAPHSFSLPSALPSPGLFSSLHFILFYFIASLVGLDGADDGWAVGHSVFFLVTETE